MALYEIWKGGSRNFDGTLRGGKLMYKMCSFSNAIRVISLMSSEYTNDVLFHVVGFGIVVCSRYGMRVVDDQHCWQEEGF